eukprot:924397-Rhodomonas_salina.1
MIESVAVIVIITLTLTTSTSTTITRAGVVLCALAGSLPGSLGRRAADVALLGRDCAGRRSVEEVEGVCVLEITCEV